MEYTFTVKIRSASGDELTDDEIEQTESWIMDRLQSDDNPLISVEDVEAD